MEAPGASGESAPRPRGEDAARILDASGLDGLIARLRDAGYDVLGPVVRDGAIVPGPLAGAGDLPHGFNDEQSPGDYRLVSGEGEGFFDWAVGPISWKGTFYPAREVQWRARVHDGTVTEVPTPGHRAAPVAIVGARPCDLAGLGVLDRVMAEGRYGDDRYRRARASSLVVGVECAHPSSTCFCTSMGTGPDVTEGCDVALSELSDERGHRFLARAVSDKGEEVLAALSSRPADEVDERSRHELLERARSRIERRLQSDGLAERLARNLEHPRWGDVANRCLACGNCTLVCPTCFCADLRDTTDLEGVVSRERTWSSCFQVDHSFVHGGPVRASVSSRYRQWMTHKLSTWWDQFDTAGCVGCGRCLTWCPVGIDLTEEAAVIGAEDATAPVAVPSRKGSS